MKKTYRIAQTVFIPHTASVEIEIEEDELPEVLNMVCTRLHLTDESLTAVKESYGYDFDTHDNMPVYTIAEKLDTAHNIECEPDMWGEWMGTYNLWVEDVTPKEENNVAN